MNEPTTKRILVFLIAIALIGCSPDADSQTKTGDLANASPLAGVKDVVIAPTETVETPTAQAEKHVWYNLPYTVDDINFQRLDVYLPA